MPLHSLTCFCSMRYNSPTAEATFKRLSVDCETVGFACSRGARTQEPWVQIRHIIERSIDSSFAVLVQTSPISWWVAFELYYAIGRKICLPLVLQEGDVADNEGIPNVFPDFGHIKFGFLEP